MNKGLMIVSTTCMIIAYLKGHRKGFYTELMIEGLLPYHLAEIDQEASKN